MDDITSLRPYRGVLKLSCDGVQSCGSAWFASYFNKKQVEHKSKRLRSVKARYPRSKIGLEIPVIKLKQDIYCPRFIFRENHLNVKHQLGYGSYSQVWMAEQGNSEKVALKQFDLRKVRAEIVWKERDFLVFLKHKRICNIQGAFFDGDAFLVLDLCFGSLRSVLSQVSKQNAIRFAIQLGEALKWCEEKRIIHCDLKSDNVLVTTSNNVVVSDFGRALLVPQGISVVKAKENLGVTEYQDYETNTEFTYSFQTDVYSFGCIFYELIAHKSLVHYNIAGVPKEEYIKVSKEGRLLNLKIWPPTTFVREALKHRVCTTTGEFERYIVPLIESRRKRWTASMFLHSAIIGELHNKIMLSGSFLDNDITDIVTKSQNRAEGRNFALKCKKMTDNMIAAFHGFYYDEKEVDGENVTRKALVSYDAHIVANFIKSCNMVPQLVDALSKNDPVADAQLLTLVHLWLGKNIKPTQSLGNETLQIVPIVKENILGKSDRILALASSLVSSESTDDAVLNRSETTKGLLDHEIRTEKNINDNIVPVHNQTIKTDNKISLNEKHITIARPCKIGHATEEHATSDSNGPTKNPEYFKIVFQGFSSYTEEPGEANEKSSYHATYNQEITVDWTTLTNNKLIKEPLEQTGEQSLQQRDSDSELDKNENLKIDEYPPKKKMRPGILMTVLKKKSDQWDKFDDKTQDPSFKPTTSTSKTVEKTITRPSQRRPGNGKKIKRSDGTRIQAATAMRSSNDGSGTEDKRASTTSSKTQNLPKVVLSSERATSEKVISTKNLSKALTCAENSDLLILASLSTADGPPESSKDNEAWKCPCCIFQDDSAETVEKHMETCKELLKKNKRRAQ